MSSLQNKNIGMSILPLLIIGGVASLVWVTIVTAAGISPQEVVRLVNEERARTELQPLQENALLSRAAEAKARDMLKNDYFAHTSPSGKTPWSWLKEAGYQYRAAGENLAINYDSAKEQHRAWMKSASHRANILNGKYREIGVAVVQGKIDGESSIVTVQFFGTPLAGTASAPAKPLVPAVTPAPAIKGTETEKLLQLEPAVLPESPAMPLAVPETNAPAQQPTPVVPVLFENRLGFWLDFSFLFAYATIGLTLLASPLAFVVKTFMTVRQRPLASPVPQGLQLMVVSQK